MRYIRNIPKELSIEARGNSLYKYVHYFEKPITFEDFCEDFLKNRNGDEDECHQVFNWLVANNLVAFDFFE